MGLGERLMPYLDDESPYAVHRYIHGSGDQQYTGRYFETYPAAPSPAAATGGAHDRIEAQDLVATTMLSIEIRLRSRSGFATANILRLAELEQEVSELLRQVDDVDLHTLTADEYSALIGDETAPAAQLWRLLREQVGFPPVATFKLLARKRPRLLPIRDSVLVGALGRQQDWWRAWWEALTTNPKLVQRLDEVRRDADAPTLSLLRTADVAVWMSGRSPTT